MKLGRFFIIGAMGAWFITACTPKVTIAVQELTLTQVASLPSQFPFPTQTDNPIPTQTSIPTEAATLPAATQIPVWGMGMVQISPGGSTTGFEQVVQAGIDWVRTDAVVSWAAVEPEKGTRNWNALAGLAQQWQAASSLGIAPIVVVRVTPSWAQQFPGYSCGPIKAEELSGFASFMHDLVARYSIAPYNVKYWEIWNEPDIDRGLVGASSDWGCWGNQDDPYYGGGYYATMLQAVYPQIKAADPQAQVLTGGLLLGCDPHPGAGCDFMQRSNPGSKFLEGILYHDGANDGGNFFDGISFHAYDYYDPVLYPGVYSNADWQSASYRYIDQNNKEWQIGPVLIAKSQFIKSLLSQYGVSGKFLINTEVAVVCDLCNNDPLYETTKASYMAQAYAAAMAQGLQANLWYSMDGWRNSGLFNPDLSPRPAFTAYQFSRNELRDSTFVSEITQYSGVKGYEFQRGSGRIWVLWSVDGTEQEIILDTPPNAVFDAFGNNLPTNERLQVTLAPIYVER